MDGVQEKPRETTHATNGEQIDRWFTYHKPKADQPQRYEVLRAAARHLANMADECVPNGPDKSAGFRLLREAVMTFNAGIAIEESKQP